MSGQHERPRVGIVVQARMGSSRFPGKMLMDLDGVSVLAQVVRRMQRTTDIDAIVVATSDKEIDDPIERSCAALETECFRGSESDVLDRFARAANAHDMDLVVRVCGDAPLTDLSGISELIDVHRADPSLDLIHTRHSTGWPIGAAADLMSRTALERANREADRADEREHVTPYLERGDAGFSVRMIEGPREYLSEPYYMAVDYPDDLEWFRRLYKGCESALGGPGLEDVFRWIGRTGDRPRLHQWNN